MTNQETRMILTKQIIERIEEEGKLPWQKPWTASTPLSMATGKAYRGFNKLALSMTAMFKGHSSCWWGTKKAIHDKGGYIRDGEWQESTPVILFKPFVKRIVNPVTGLGEHKTLWLMRHYFVWNAAQCHMADDSSKPIDLQEPGSIDCDPIAKAVAITEGYPHLKRRPPIICYSNMDRASYNPKTDFITMPPRQMFNGNAGAFYGTLFHELAHSTGHEDRLDRKLDSEFGTASYAREELIAELGACFLCQEAGVVGTATMDNSDAYLKHWIGVLREDPGLLIIAAGQADRAADYILGRNNDQGRRNQVASLPADEE